MTTAAVGDGRFDMGRVVQRTFQVLGRNFVPFFLVSLLLAGLPALLIGWIQANNMAAMSTTGAPNFALIGLWSLIGALVSIVMSSLLQAALVTGTVSDLNGRKLSLGEMVAAGMPFILPLIAISLLYGLALVVGFILLLVPGLIMLTVWAVVLPAAVTERTGIFGAFDRSAALTRGHRWAIFGLFVAVGLALIVVALILGGLLGVFVHGTTTVGRLPTMTPAGLVLNALIRSFQGLIAATLIACLYYELRTIKEGVAPQALAQVFA